VLLHAVRGGRVEEITAELADILEQRAFEGDDIVPETARGKLLLDHHGAADDEKAADRDDASDAMIHRQAIVHAIGRSHIHHAGEPAAPRHDPVVADIGGLGQPGRARGVDAQRSLRERYLAALRRGEFLSPEDFDLGLEAGEIANLRHRHRRRPMHP
jgi:hypothetical protein